MGRRRRTWTGHKNTDTLPINLLQPHKRTHTHTRTLRLDWSQRLPSACVCMLAYCTRECVILMCESEWMGVEMSLLIFGKYRGSVCYMLSRPTLFLWRKFRLKFVFTVQLGLEISERHFFKDHFYVTYTKKTPTCVTQPFLKNTWIKSIVQEWLLHPIYCVFGVFQ